MQICLYLGLCLYLPCTCAQTQARSLDPHHALERGNVVGMAGKKITESPKQEAMSIVNRNYFVRDGAPVSNIETRQKASSSSQSSDATDEDALRASKKPKTASNDKPSASADACAIPSEPVSESSNSRDEDALRASEKAKTAANDFPSASAAACSRDSESLGDYEYEEVENEAPSVDGSAENKKSSVASQDEAEMSSPSKKGDASAEEESYSYEYDSSTESNDEEKRRSPWPYDSHSQSPDPDAISSTSTDSEDKEKRNTSARKRARRDE